MSNNAKPITVMIVDDNDLDRRLLERNLKKTQLSLVLIETSGGEEAINLLTQPREKLEALYPQMDAPVVLFLDINMPVMDGWEVLEALETNRSKIKFNPAVVLMHSTSNTQWEKNKAFEFGPVADYIIKGDYTTEQLQQSILDCHRAA